MILGKYKKYCHKFQYIDIFLFLLFCFAMKMSRYGGKKLAYLLRYASNQYKTQQMYKKATLEYSETFTSAKKIRKFVIKHLIITLIH